MAWMLSDGTLAIILGAPKHSILAGHCLHILVVSMKYKPKLVRSSKTLYLVVSFEPNDTKQVVADTTLS